MAVAGQLLAMQAMVRGQDAKAFDEGSFVLQATGSYLAGSAVFDTKFASGVTGAFGVGYYFRDNFGFYAEGLGIGLTHIDPETDAAGGGLNLMLRYHFLEFADGNATLFIEAGGGIARLDQEWPDNGTHNNFIGRAGLGATYCISRDRDVHLVGGLRYFHLSNGYRHGEDENPNYDAGEVWAGVLWKM